MPPTREVTVRTLFIWPPLGVQATVHAQLLDMVGLLFSGWAQSGRGCPENFLVGFPNAAPSKKRSGTPA